LRAMFRHAVVGVDQCWRADMESAPAVCAWLSLWESWHGKAVTERACKEGAYEEGETFS